MLSMCMEILTESFEEGKEFVIEELDEVERLINAQIICQGPITIYKYSNIEQRDAFQPMVPIEVPNQIHNARNSYREQVDNQQAALPETVLYKLRSYGALLIQGQFYIFETDKMERVILTVDINKLDYIHIESGSFDIELHDNGQRVMFGVMYEEHMETWKSSFEHFTELH